MPLQQMNDFTFKHSEQVDALYKVLSSTEIKQKFDSRGVELRDFINSLVTQLNSTTDGDSGADNIGATAVAGLSGTTVQAILEELKTFIDSINTNLQDQITSNDTDISNLQDEDTNIYNALNTHKSSNDHDGRYYTKSELEGYLRGGDTLIKEEIFTIVTADNGDGTFTYSDSNDVQYTGTLDVDGYQVFDLQQGTYPVGERKIEAIINDTLRRSQASGGLKEVDDTTVAISPEGNGAEISFVYFERLGLTGEHAITHEEGGTDTITVSEAMLASALATKINDVVAKANTNETNISANTSSISANTSSINDINNRVPMKITVASTAPSNPSTNDIWIDTSS
jgi:hypothetical protein